SYTNVQLLEIHAKTSNTSNSYQILDNSSNEDIDVEMQENYEWKYSNYKNYLIYALFLLLYFYFLKEAVEKSEELSKNYYDFLQQILENHFKKHNEKLKDYVNKISSSYTDTYNEANFKYTPANHFKNRGHKFLTSIQNFKKKRRPPQLQNQLFAQSCKLLEHLLKAAHNHETIYLADLLQPVEDPNYNNAMLHLKLWA
ncbi:19667_t:CDS:2, partial [Gigaspora margarita]